MNSPVVISWLLDAAILLGFALVLGSLAYGLLLLFMPAWALNVAAGLNRRFSGRKALRPLEIPRESERFFYRHHRIVGSLLLVAVLAFFAAYFLDFPRDTLLARLSIAWGQPLAGITLESFELFFVFTNAVIALLAIVMLFRPSALKPLEASANRWLSTRRAFRHAESARQPLDEFVNRFPRLVGLLILIAAVYVMIGLLMATVWEGVTT